MKTPAEICAEAVTRYQNKWRRWLAEPPIAPMVFSLRPPTTSDLNYRDIEVDAWIRTWRAWAVRHPNASLRTKSMKTSYGPQDIFTHVEFGDVETLASASPETQAHWAKGIKRATQIASQGTTLGRLNRHLAAIVDLADADFALLLAAATWFRRNPRSGMMPRQVPVPGMHTKWLAKHRRLVLAMLGSEAVDASDDPATSQDDLDRAVDFIDERDLDALGLVAPPPLIDVILADPADRAELAGLRHLRAPVEEVAQLELAPRAVLIVENKESALIVPDALGLVIVHSLGNHLNALSQLPWLFGASTWYWGDLDRAGMTLLSRARELLPDTTSVMMDPATLDTYAHLAVPENLTRIDAPRDTLTALEIQTLGCIRDGHHEGGHLQLEQERLPQAYALATLSHLLAPAARIRPSDP